MEESLYYKYNSVFKASILLFAKVKHYILYCEIINEMLSECWKYETLLIILC